MIHYHAELGKVHTQPERSVKYVKIEVHLNMNTHS